MTTDMTVASANVTFTSELTVTERKTLNALVRVMYVTNLPINNTTLRAEIEATVAYLGTLPSNAKLIKSYISASKKIR